MNGTKTRYFINNSTSGRIIQLFTKDENGKSLDENALSRRFDTGNKVSGRLN